MWQGRGRLAAPTGLVLAALLLGAAAASDPYVASGQQWHLDRIHAPEAWATTRGGGAIVAVIDTGVRLSHQDLVDRILRQGGQVVGWDFVDDDADPSDEFGHGTLVAGVVAATEGNGVGGSGVGPALRIMPVRVLDEHGGGSGSDVSAAIEWAADHGADVINLSLECSTGGGVPVINPLACSTLGGAPEEAVAYAASKGAVVVAAAGNDGSSFTDYSSDSPVLLVGATDRNNGISSFSDRGRDDVVVAPGEEIVSTWCKTQDSQDVPCNRDDTYGMANGTSFATPQVAAAVAMLMSQGMSGPQAVARIRATARDLGSPGPDNTFGFGLLDVAAAVGTSEPTEPPTTEPPTPVPSEPETEPAPPTTEPAPTASSAPDPTASPSSSPSSSPSPSPTPTPTVQPTEEPTDGVVIGSLQDGGPDDTRPRWMAVALLLLTGAAHIGARARAYGAP